MSRKICVQLDFLNPLLTEMLTEAANAQGFELHAFGKGHNDEAKKVAPEAEILFTHYADILHCASSNLKWFCCPSAGINSYRDAEIIKTTNCLFTNSSGSFGVTISEHMVMMTLMLMRKVLGHLADARAHHWGERVPITSVYEGRFTIVGTGDIGASYARHVRNMGASKVVGINRSGRIPSDAFTAVYPVDQIESVLPETDVLVIVAPGTPETQGLITRERLAMLGKHCYFINVGRGDIVDQEALIDALNQDQLAGAAVDVVVPEPLPSEHPLWSAKNIIVTPHISGTMSLPYTGKKAVSMFCENLERYTKGEPLNNMVDVKLGY